MVDRLKMDDLLRRRFFYDQSFALYGGECRVVCARMCRCDWFVRLWPNGLCDEDEHVGCVAAAFRARGSHVASRMCYAHTRACTQVRMSAGRTLNVLYRASGHVDRFADYMVKDMETGECFRLDHLIKATCEKMLDDKNTSSDVKNDLKTVCAMVGRLAFV
jgi:glycyl-tRNA synthetase